MMRIGDVSRRAKVSASAIRYYERLGLLPEPERRGGCRLYGDGVLDRLRVIRFARQCGFTLRELKDLLGGVPYSARLRRIAKAKIEELDGAIERARAMQSLLRRALRCDCLTLDECGRRLRSVSEAR